MWLFTLFVYHTPLHLAVGNLCQGSEETRVMSGFSHTASNSPSPAELVGNTVSVLRQPLTHTLTLTQPERLVEKSESSSERRGRHWFHLPSLLGPLQPTSQPLLEAPPGRSASIGSRETTSLVKVLKGKGSNDPLFLCPLYSCQLIPMGLAVKEGSRRPEIIRITAQRKESPA